MRILSPMSEDDAAERDSQNRQLGFGDDEDEQDEEEDQLRRRGSGSSTRWSHKVERALVKLSAEVAALREQITTGREWRARKDRSFGAWLGWIAWIVMKHLAVDCVILGIVLLWMRRRKDRRLEDLVRSAVRLAREYARQMLPSR